MWLLDPNVRLPYSTQWNIALEQAVGTSQTVTATYVGSSGHRLLTLQSYVHPLTEWPNTNTLIYVQRNLSHSSYDSLQLKYERRLHRGIQLFASYVLATARDNASTASNFTPPVDILAADWGPADFDVRHQFSSAATVDLPASRGPAMLRTLTRDWGVDAILRAQSAPPANPTVGLSVAPGTRGYYNRRPDVVPSEALYIYDRNLPGGRRFNPAAFATPAAGQQGSFGRNGLRAFAAAQLDLSLRREFRLGTRIRAQFRAELFNVLNHPNFGRPVTSTSSPQFGRPTDMLNRSLGGLSALYQFGGPRSGELAAKLLF
jgi:hypothetical protein